MRIGIDGSNISSGGGVTHLCEILNALDLPEFGIEEIEVWSIEDTLSKIWERDGIVLKNDPAIESNLFNRLYWQQKKLSNIASERYDILYVPGGSYLGSFHPFVTMNRNLQPFDDETRRRYNLSFQKMRLALLEKVQAKTYRNAAGVIFLSKEAKDMTTKKIGNRIENTKIVPHGIANKFFKEPKKMKDNDSYSFDKPFQFLYASRINVYKHQWNVIEAIRKLREEGYPIILNLVGNIENKQ
jgi:glycosyltransferase involved in cell wall biosynthesis